MTQEEFLKSLIYKEKPRHNSKYLIQDYIGMKFGRLEVIARVPSTDPTFWLVRCDCGTEFKARAYNVVTGNTKSCGCLRKKKVKKSDR